MNDGLIPARADIEREFDDLHRFLSEQLPKQFNRDCVDDESFGVGEEVDDDLIASFLMTYDQFNQRVPLAIQTFLHSLRLEWTVYGSFGIKHPFNTDGTLNPSPRFTVTRSSISGEVDMRNLESRLGPELRRLSQ